MWRNDLRKSGISKNAWNFLNILVIDIGELIKWHSNKYCSKYWKRHSMKEKLLLNAVKLT
jgi:hypothetical protein